MNSKPESAVNTDIAENRKKLAEKFGKASTGGNTARRKHKTTGKTTVISRLDPYLL